MKPFQFSTPASAELAEAVRWYERRRSGLGAQAYKRALEVSCRILEITSVRSATQAELVAVVADVLAEGLRKSERCRYLPAADDPTADRTALRDCLPLAL